MTKLVFLKERGIQVPREIIPFLNGLETIVGHQKVGFGHCSFHGTSKREIKITGYDEQKKLLDIKINRPDYSQVLRIRVSFPEEITKVKGYVDNYNARNP